MCISKEYRGFWESKERIVLHSFVRTTLDGIKEWFKSMVSPQICG